MAKYKLLTQRGYSYFTKGMIYDESYKNATTVKALVEKFPQDWLLVEDNDNESTDEFKDIYQSLLNMQRAKDAKYGNSALKPLDIFAKHHNYGARLDEKVARIKHSDELRKNDVADLIGGLVLICKDKGWTNFDDLID